MAKRRAVNGVSLRVTVRDQFTPGRGGSADIVVAKDRPGGLRAYCPPGRLARAGRFLLTDDGTGALAWSVTDPAPQEAPDAYADADLAQVLAMPRRQRSKRGVMRLLGCGTDRAMRILGVCREMGEYDPADWSSGKNGEDRSGAILPENGPVPPSEDSEQGRRPGDMDGGE